MTEQFTRWRKSSRSGENNCVEVAMTLDAVLVRDSKDQGGPVLSFTAAAINALIADLKEGELAGPSA